MTRSLPIAAVLLLSLEIAGCGGPKIVDEDGVQFAVLFNGRNLRGWVIENDAKFSVRDGVMFLDGGTGWLRSKDEHDDFVLEIEFRFLEEGANSGIFVRTAATSRKNKEGWPNNGYQVQCMDTLTGHVLGSMIPYGAPPFTHKTDMDALKTAYKPAGEWHKYEIRCVGEDLEVKLNGIVVTTATGISNLSGHVGIQGENGKLEFRSIRMRKP